MLAITKVKNEIEFNKNFRSLLEVLKSIAVAQFHVLEKKLRDFDSFDRVLDNFLQQFNPKILEHPFLHTNDGPGTVVAVTSDQGLLGGMNMRVVTNAINLMKSGRDELIIVGDRGQIYARDSRVPFTAYPGIRDEEASSQVLALRDYVFGKAMAGERGSLSVVFPRALSLSNQRVETIPLLPYATGTQASSSNVHLSEMILESTPARMLEYLVLLRIGHKLSEVFRMSRLAELGARYMHLEENSQKIEQVNQKLKLRYFRLRHEIIDQSMRELFSARSLYAG